MSQSSDASRDLLFGLLGLQTGLIDEEALFAAFAAWSREKTSCLADHFIKLGHFDAPRRAAVEAITGLHVQASGGDPAKSLSVLPVGRSICERLGQAGGSQVEATLGHLRSMQGSTHDDEDDDGDAVRIGSYSVGGVTSDGQRFRILRPHAKGGLGAVFVALDSELRREVALKQILEKHADDPGSRGRFVAEAEITGALEHPGVVPVYGVGTDALGRPYYAMRFIKGDSFREAINRFHNDEALQRDPARRSLKLRELNRRFTDVCNAIDYAHSRGVIHRDLKPANIILGKHGETLVVDWGLAKAVGRADASVGEQTISLSSGGSSETLPGSAVGTPAYMSPEQARGELNRLGPRSDVYSLGATLYCVLTGSAPFEGEEIGAVLRAVREGKFKRPSQRDPELDRALEAVCLKAMATDPEDRYATPRALADDVDRWMADEPVTAWREPLARRARRWARRNRTVMTAAAVALVAGVIGLATVLAVQTLAKAELAESLTRETTAKTALTETNAKLTRSQAAVLARYDLAVEAIKTFHTGVSEDFLLKEPLFKDVRDRLLESASDFYGKLGTLLGEETDLASRRALWQANAEVAELTAKVGKPEDALEAHQQVLAAREGMAVEYPADAEIKSDVGRSLTAVAKLLEDTGRTDEAEATYRRAETLLVEPARTIADAAFARAALAHCRSNLGWLLHTTGRNDEALSVYRLARADQEALAAAPGATAECRRDLALTINRVAFTLSNTGRLPEAEADFRQALALNQKLTVESPTVAGFRNELARSHGLLGELLRQRGKSIEAEAEYRQALAIQQKLAYDNPAVTQFRGFLANHHFGLCILLSDTGKPTEAQAEYRRALAIRKKLADDNPSIPDFQSDLADMLSSIGWRLTQAGKTDEAIGFHTREESIRRKLADAGSATPGDRDALANCQTNMADVLRRSGRLDEALAACERTLAVREPLVEAYPDVPGYRARLGETYLRLGQARFDMKNVAGAAAAWKRACQHHDATKSLTGLHTFFLACCRAGLAGLAGRPGSGVTAPDGADEAENAMAGLRQAVTMGYRNPDAYRTESALDPLRNRRDFRALMMDLAFPAQPLAKGRED